MATQTFRHPKVLPFLFLTEMWERFGFYIVQGLFVLYMTQHFGLSDSNSYTVSGVFAALLYIAPFLGGPLADRVLGFKTSIIWGGIFLIAGYSIVAVSTTLPIFYLGLAAVITGNGLFKPNISSLLGTQYEPQNPKRDAGFTIFYIGINIGVALSGFSGYIKDTYGYPTTYALASLGMFLGLLTFVFGTRFLKQTQSVRATAFVKLKVFIGCIAACAGIYYLLQMEALTDILLPLSGVVLLVWLAIIMVRENATNRKSLLVLNTLIICSIIFWMLFLQMFNSANLYNDRFVEKSLYGIPLTTTMFWASESVYIFLLGPLFAWYWHVLGARGKNPSPINKFVLGILFTGAGFIVLGCSANFPNEAGMINPLWVFASYFFITVGELLISPVGLSSVTLLSPQRLVGMMMGVWFVALGFGGYFAGMIAKFASVGPLVASTTDKLAIYQDAFFLYACIAFVTAIVLFLMQFMVKKAI